MADLRFRNVVNGESTDAADGATYDLVNPATGEVYAAAPASSAEDVDRAMRAAEAAFEAWGETTPTERHPEGECREEHQRAGRGDGGGSEPVGDRRAESARADAGDPGTADRPGLGRQQREAERRRRIRPNCRVDSADPRAVLLPVASVGPAWIAPRCPMPARAVVWPDERHPRRAGH